MSNLYDNMMDLDLIPIKEGLVNLLRETWAKVSISHCRSILERKSVDGTISESDIARVELTPDEIRCFVYESMNRWDHTHYQYLLDEWFDLKIDEQNALLIKAFPEGQVYGV